MALMSMLNSAGFRSLRTKQIEKCFLMRAKQFVDERVESGCLHLPPPCTQLSYNKPYKELPEGICRITSGGECKEF